MQPCSQPRYGFSETEKGMSGLSLWVISEREVSRRNSVASRPPSSGAGGLSASSGSASTCRRSKRLAGFWAAPRPRAAGAPRGARSCMPPLYCIRRGLRQDARTPRSRRSGTRGRRRLFHAGGELLGALLVGGGGVRRAHLAVGDRGHLQLSLGGGEPAVLEHPPGLADHDRLKVLDALGQLGPGLGERGHFPLQLAGRGAHLPLLRLERQQAPDVRRQDGDDRNQNPPFLHRGVPHLDSTVAAFSLPQRGGPLSA